ncbi:MAG: flavodoxin family protein [Mogibacterium sp.]|nr:flavodoxin family protein [Mogibacterium sp.]
MGLLIHDLSSEEWTRVSREYDGWDIVSDNGSIRPCVGYFSCWNRDPGRCAIKDGYDNMGSLIHHADEVVVISRYTYGGFSGFVKNVFDRCLGYVLPQFEVAGGETHHQKRYDEDKPFTFIFYGHDLNEDEKNSARRYVTAVCANIRGHVKDVIFRECEDLPAPERTSEGMALPARAINTESKTYDIYAEHRGLPKWLFIQIANVNWDRTRRRTA